MFDVSEGGLIPLSSLPHKEGRNPAVKLNIMETIERKQWDFLSFCFPTKRTEPPSVPASLQVDHKKDRRRH